MVSVGLFAKYLEKMWMDFEKIFRKCKQWQKFCFRDPDHSLGPGIFKMIFQFGFMDFLFGLMKYSGNTDNGTMNLGGDLYHPLDIEFFQGFLIIILINHGGGAGLWRRFALSECFSNLQICDSHLKVLTFKIVHIPELILIGRKQ